jgi:hypothetical protein
MIIRLLLLRPMISGRRRRDLFAFPPLDAEEMGESLPLDLRFLL